VALSSANSALAFVSREGLPVLGILLNLEEGLQDALLLERGLLFTSSSNPAAAAQKKAHDNAIDLVREALSQYAEIPRSKKRTCCGPTSQLRSRPGAARPTKC
jgi:hypothetical protein